MVNVTKMAIFGILASNDFTFNKRNSAVFTMGRSINSSDFTEYESAHASRKLGKRYAHVIVSILKDQTLSHTNFRIYTAITNSAYISPSHALEVFDEVDYDFSNGKLVFDVLDLELRHLLKEAVSPVTSVSDTNPGGFFNFLNRLFDSVMSVIRR